MGISTEKAYEILTLPLGASKDAIEQSYKKLAFKWHPEKQHTPEALKKFKSISIAYRKLVNNERDDKDMSLHEMFQQYRQVFHSKHSASGSNKKEASSKVINSSVKNSKEENNSQEEEEEEEEDAEEDDEESLNNEDEENDEIKVKLRARAFAIKGNDLAFHGQYEKAIEQFGEAIKTEPSDFKFYGNRSYCYDKLGLYEDALQDAEKAIEIEPSWPKGYYRKGRALSGLKNYTEAEAAYVKLLELDNTSENTELIEELNKVRALQLQEMGFSRAQAESSVKQHHTIKAALESILSYASINSENEECQDDEDQNNNNFKSSNKNAVYSSNEYNNDKEEEDDDDNEEYEEDDENDAEDATVVNDINMSKQNGLKPLQIKTTTAAPLGLSSTSSSTSSSSSSSSSINAGDFKTIGGFSLVESNSSNKNKHLTSLWVGNVDPKVSEKKLTELFNQFGEVTTVRCLAEKYCAFVNFKHREDANKAMAKLQGKLVEGQKLLIKYPDNPSTSILNTNQPLQPQPQQKPKEPAPVAIKKDSNTIILKQVNSNNHNHNNKSHHDSSIALTKATPTTAHLNQNDLQKLSGPVNGNECYFWRTTGCVYADKCRYLHISKHKGIDKKPWHKPAI